MIESIIKRVKAAQHTVLILHVNPDADSFGSASAFYTYMLQLHQKVTLFCVTPKLDRKLFSIPWFDKIKHQFPSSADLAVSFDCGSVQRLGIDVMCDIINIDHHRSNNSFGTLNLIDCNAISTTEVLYDFFKSVNVKLNAKMATALYAGLLDDSQNFLHQKTEAKHFNMAADLLNCNANTKGIIHSLYKNNSLASLRLKGLMFQELKLRCNGQVAVLHVNLEMLRRSGALPQETEVALEESLTLSTVSVALLLREQHSGGIKGSLRGDGVIDVSVLAQIFGGGGHRDAAGFNVVDGTFYALEEQIVNKLCKELN
jgi:phosphoesterase RecJ-like protein